MSGRYPRIYVSDILNHLNPFDLHHLKELSNMLLVNKEYSENYQRHLKKKIYKKVKIKAIQKMDFNSCYSAWFNYKISSDSESNDNEGKKRSDTELFDLGLDLLNFYQKIEEMQIFSLLKSFQSKHVFVTIKNLPTHFLKFENVFNFSRPRKLSQICDLNRPNNLYLSHENMKKFLPTGKYLVFGLEKSVAVPLIIFLNALIKAYLDRWSNEKERAGKFTTSFFYKKNLEGEFVFYFNCLLIEFYNQKNEMLDPELVYKNIDTIEANKIHILLNNFSVHQMMIIKNPD